MAGFEIAPSLLSADFTELGDAIRSLCNLLTKMQRRAVEYLQPEGDPVAFIDDILELLDGPEQRLAQGRARQLLNEPHEQITLRRSD